MGSIAKGACGTCGERGYVYNINRQYLSLKYCRFWLPYVWGCKICSLFIAFIGGLIVKPRWLVAEKMVKISIMGTFLCHNRVVWHKCEKKYLFVVFFLLKVLWSPYFCNRIILPWSETQDNVGSWSDFVSLKKSCIMALIPILTAVVGLIAAISEHNKENKENDKNKWLPIYGVM